MTQLNLYNFNDLVYDWYIELMRSLPDDDILFDVANVYDHPEEWFAKVIVDIKNKVLKDWPLLHYDSLRQVEIIHLKVSPDCSLIKFVLYRSSNSGGISRSYQYNILNKSLVPMIYNSEE